MGILSRFVPYKKSRKLLYDFVLKRRKPPVVTATDLFDNPAACLTSLAKRSAFYCF
jgi:hypothetical protein